MGFLTNGARNLVRAILTGHSEMSRQRYAICRSCPFRKVTPIEYCGICKCKLPEKTFHRDEECPRGYWRAQQ